MHDFGYGLMDTTHVDPVKTPAGFKGIELRYMGTLRSRSACLGGRPARQSADSKL